MKTPHPRERRTRLILEVNVDVTSTREMVETIGQAIAGKAAMRIAFANAHLATLASGNATVATSLRDFRILNDGIGVDLASHVLYGQKFPENLNGTDFIPALLTRLRPGLRLYLLGGTWNVIDAAAEAFKKRWPQHHIVGFSHGFHSNEDELALCSIIKQARPDMILVGMGSPRQELWIARHIPDVCAIGIGVGALFNFQANAIPRAPLMLRKARLEWMFRLALEPRRLWRRYLFGNIVFLWQVALQLMKGERV